MPGTSAAGAGAADGPQRTAGHATDGTRVNGSDREVLVTTTVTVEVDEDELTAAAGLLGTRETGRRRRALSLLSCSPSARMAIALAAASQPAAMAGRLSR
jgi:hypothetical protein